MLSLTVITLNCDKNANYQWQWPGCQQGRRLSWLQLRSQYWKNWDLEGFVVFFSLPQRDAILDTPIYTRGAAVFSGIKELQGKDGEKGKEILPFENWAMLSSVFDRKGQGDERRRLEGTFGSSDLRGSKPRPFAFVSPTRLPAQLR